MSSGRAQLTEIYEQYIQLELILAVRLDLAYQLYIELNKLTPEESEQYVNMKQGIECFLLTVLNIKSVEFIDSLMMDRELHKPADIEYIPKKTPLLCQHFLDPAQAKTKFSGLWRQAAFVALYVKNGKLLTISEEMREDDEDDEMEMLLPLGRDKDRVIIANNLFLKRTSDNKFVVVDTKDNVSHETAGLASFLITIKGEMLVFDRINEMDDEKRIYSHSSYSNGGVAFIAGEIKIKNGELLIIGSHSGHYKPQLENLYQCLKYFKEQGINIANTLIYSYSHHVRTPLSLQPIKNAQKISHYSIVFSANDLIDYFDKKLPEGKAVSNQRYQVKKN